MSEEQGQKSSRPRIKVIVAELIKLNVNAAIRDRQMKERAFVDYLADAVRIYATLHPSKPQPAELLDLEELKSSSDPNKWGQKAIGERIGRESGAMWRTLNPLEDGGNSSFDVLELLLIAADLQVPISFLLFPTREQVEENAILVFDEFNPPLEVSANQWISWVSGLSALPGKDSILQANNALSLSTAHMASWEEDVRDAPRAKATDMLNIEDTQRINEGLLSASAPFLDALTSSIFRNPNNIYPLVGNESEALSSEHQIAINRSRILQDLLFHLREAVVIASDQNRLDAANAVIEVSEKIKKDIASLFLAEDRDVTLPSIPFSKDFMVEQLKLITMMLAHVSLAEIEHNGFQAERLPHNVRLKKEPFKMERDVPDYMEGAFDHRLKLEKDFKKDLRQAQKETPEESS